MVMIGIDPHKGSHTAVVIDGDERVVDEIRVRTSGGQTGELSEWAASYPDRVWAVESARGMGYLVSQQLVAAGERVIDVPAMMASRVRLLGSGRSQKTDPNDARSVEGESIPAGPSVSQVKVSGASTSGRASVVEMVLDAGWDGPPPHVHGEIDHVWFVFKGQVQVRLGDEELDLRAGDVAWVPHGQPHNFATGPEHATMLQFDTPRPLDAYFQDLADAFPRDSAGSVDCERDPWPVTTPDRSQDDQSMAS